VLDAAYIASLAGDRDLTAEAVDLVRRTRYRATADGLDGNDDGGTLSAWYLWSALGIYPIAGTDRYAIGTPLFERVEIDRPDGTLVVRGRGSGIYVDGVSLGGGPVEGNELTHAAWMDGGELVFDLVEGR
jgi:putative alpha-1,2-mannosidase